MSTTALLVVHPSDKSWVSISDYLSVLSERHLLSDFLIMSATENAAEGDVPVVVTTEDGVNSDKLYDYLARTGHTDSLVIAGVISSELSTQDQESINSSIELLNAGLTRLAGSVDRLNVRISIPGDLEKVASPPFFTPVSDANVVILPRDQARNQAVARPITRDNQEIFAKHSAVELSSVLGIWKFMDSCVLEKVERKHQGIGGYEVVFVSSRVKGVLAPPLPIGALVDESGELPIPPTFTALERPHLISLRYAQSIYPDSLRFEHPVRPEYRVERKLWGLVRQYVREIGSVIVGLPSTFWRGLQNDVNEIAGNAMTSAMGGEDSWVSVVWDNMNSGDTLHFLQHDEVHEVIREIELRAERPVLSVVPTSTWDQMIDQVFGIADGAEIADGLRRSLTQSTFLMLDKQSLAPRATSLIETATQSLGHDQSWDPINAVSMDELTTESPELPLMQDEAVDIESESISVSEGSSEKNLEESGSSEEVADRVDAPTAGSGQSTERVTSQDVVGGITQELVSNYEAASHSAVLLLNEIQTLPGQFVGKDLGRISRSVLIGIASAIGLLFVAIGSMTPARGIASFEFMRRTTAVQIWLMFSTIFIVVAIITGINGGKQTWQGRAMFSALISSGIVAAEYIFFSPVYKWLNSFSYIKKSNIPAVLIFIATLAFCSLSIIRNLGSKELTRQKIGKFLLLFVWFYIVLGITGWFSSSESFLQRAPAAIKTRFFLSANFVGWIVLFTGLLIIAILRIREKNRVGKAGHDFRNACIELETCVDARTRLDIATAQWLGIAAVAARTIWYPLGKRVSELQASDESLTGDESILKFDLANIRLRASGTSHLLSRLRQRFVRSGWLWSQLHVAIDAYTAVEAFDSGNEPEHHYPFGCSSSPTVSEILIGYNRGDRWGFAYKYFNGEYDEQLLNSAVQQRIPDMYRDLVSDARMHELSDAQNEYGTSFDFLNDVVPTVRKQIPPGLTTALFTANQKESSMRSFIWWPETDIGETNANFVEEVLNIETIKAKTYRDSEMILAATVDLSHSFHCDDLTGATRDETVDVSEGHGW